MYTITLTIYTLLGPPVITTITTVNRNVRTTARLRPLLVNVIVTMIINVLLALPASDTTVYVTVKLNNMTNNTTIINYTTRVVNFTITDFGSGKVDNIISRNLNADVLRVPGILGGPIILLPTIITDTVINPVTAINFNLTYATAKTNVNATKLMKMFNIVRTSRRVVDDTRL